MNPLILNPSNVAEKGISTYISASINSGSLYANVYTGMDNEDKIAPAIIVFVKDATEVVFNSRCYAFDVDIVVKEIATDDTVDNYSTLAGNVLSLFTDSVSGSLATSQFCQGNGIGINFWQIQIGNYNSVTVGDAWINNFNFRFIGACVPI